MKDTKQRSEPKIEVLLEYANGVIATLREPFLVLDKNLRVISANRAFYTTFKVAENSTKGRPLPDLGDGQWHIPKLLQLLRELIPEHKVVNNYEVEHNFENLGCRTMILNALQLRVPKEVAAIIAATAREEQEQEQEQEKEQEHLILLAIEDITERKRLEGELKESEERYRRAFETSRDGLLLVHKTGGDILNSNESIKELLGYSQEELLQKKLWEIGVANNELDFRETVSILEKDGVIHFEDIPITANNGLSVSAEVFLVDRAKVMQCNVRDISERKRAEEVLKDSEMRFKAVFNRSTDGLLLAEVETKRISMCNPTMCQMLGYTEEEMMRMGVDDVHRQRECSLMIEQFVRQAKGEIEPAAGVPVKKKDGSIFYADVSTSLITFGGQEHLLGSFRDITGRKIIEDELKEKVQDLERFSKFAVDRELKMEELEKKIRDLEERLQSK